MLRVLTIKRASTNLHLPLLLIQMVIFLIQSTAFSASIPSGRRLKDIVAEKFPDSNFILGATIGAVGLDTTLGEILNREFSYATPENDFKQTVVHPNPGVWNFTNAEKWIQNIGKYDQIARVHAPIGPQCSDWAKDDTRSIDELNQNLQEFFTTVCSLSNNVPRFKYIDVVNETVIKGEWHREKAGLLWECPWYILGQESDEFRTPVYIKKAFGIANRYAPNLKLIYNQHQIFDSPQTETLLFATIRKLREQGLRVDGIGWQAHIDNGWATDDNLNELRRFIDKCQSENLEFHITEASVYIKEPLTASQLQIQADTYSRMLSVLLEKTGTRKIGWNTWHVADMYTAHAEWYPSLFDTLGDPKPAYFAIQNVLEKYVPQSKSVTSYTKNMSTPVRIKKYDRKTRSISFVVPSEINYFECEIVNLQGCQIARNNFKMYGTGSKEILWNLPSQLPSNFILLFSHNSTHYSQFVVDLSPLQ